jgi:HD superfamily phosphodiesterase
MEVFHYTNEIYKSELPKNPYLKEEEKIIFTSAILHDMCDKKYRKEKEGVIEIRHLLEQSPCFSFTKKEIDAVIDIISTMSYSKVKVKGFPQLEEHQLSYHIVREADLLTAYDFDRAMIYQMLKNKDSYMDSFDQSKELFEKRVLQYRKDGLFITSYSKCKSLQMHNNAVKYIRQLEKTIRCRQNK